LPITIFIFSAFLAIVITFAIFAII